MQYPQPRQKSPLSSFCSFSIYAVSSGVMDGVLSIYPSHSSSSVSFWIPQIGSALSYWVMNAIAASERLIRPPARPFMAMNPIFFSLQALTSAFSLSDDR